jgi:hypothetical protein
MMPVFCVVATSFTASTGPLIIEKKVAQNMTLTTGMLLFSCLSLLIRNHHFYNRFFIEAFLLLAPLMALMFWKITHDYEKVLTVCLCGMVAAYIIQVTYNLQSMEFGSLSDAIQNSYMPTETGYIAFVFGLFFIHFFYHDRKKIWLLGILLILSFKRINFVAVPIAIILSGVFYNQKSIKLLPILALIMNALFIVLLRGFFLGNFDNIIEETFGIAPNVLSMGRQTILAEMNEHVKSISWLGIGLGKSVDLLSNSIQLEGINNLHSDLIKNFIEFGPVVFSIWIYSFYRINAISRTGLALTFYLNIIYLTDNVSIYFFVMTVFYYLIAVNNHKIHV